MQDIEQVPGQTNEQVLTAALRAEMRTMEPLQLLAWLEGLPAEIQTTVMEVIDSE